ncbi:unnamed protein product [Hymenolepis diminuta]|uniref:Chromo domain-containing protein n=1 Tax=Hymenolepis diminuta TaxID=6216 RepID=A0A0R3SBD7_HYMDI|nr:unnamed protein product [Hymenolepis diminuta]
MSVVGKDEKGNKFYKVEKILKRRTIKGEKFYRIQWVGYPIKEATWEPMENISPYLVEEFEKNEKTNKGNKRGAFVKRHLSNCRKVKSPKSNRKSLKHKKNCCRAPSNNTVDDDKKRIPEMGKTNNNENTSTASNHILSEADNSSPTTHSTSQISNDSERAWILNSEGNHGRTNSTDNVSTCINNAITNDYETVGFQALSEDMTANNEDLISAAGTLNIIEKKSMATNPLLEEIYSNPPATVASTPLIPYNENETAERTRNFEKIDARTCGSEPMSESNFTAETPIHYVPDNSQAPSFNKNEVNKEIATTSIKENDSILPHSPAIETAVNPSRGLFSTSEESEPIEIDEITCSGGIKPPSSSSKESERILECVLREVKDKDGNIFFRVKWQDTETPEKVSEERMTRYATEVFEYYRRRISELKALLGRI